MFDWGKFYKKNGRMVMPVSVQAHHSFVDGLHIGQFADLLQKYLDEYESGLSKSGYYDIV